MYCVAGRRFGSRFDSPRPDPYRSLLQAELLSGVPVPLFDTRVTGFVPYDVAPNGRLSIDAVPAGASSINIVVRSQARLSR